MQSSQYGPTQLHSSSVWRDLIRGAWRMPSSLAVAVLVVSASVALPALGNSLPFRSLDDTGRFTVSELTAPYERDLDRILDTKEKQPTDLAVLDEHGWFPMDDVPYRTDTYDMFQQAADEVPQDQLTPEEEVAGESGTAGVQVGIPSPAAVTGSILGGLGVLASILSDWF